MAVVGLGEAQPAVAGRLASVARLVDAAARTLPLAVGGGGPPARRSAGASHLARGRGGDPDRSGGAAGGGARGMGPGPASVASEVCDSCVGGSGRAAGGPRGRQRRALARAMAPGGAPTRPRVIMTHGARWGAARRRQGRRWRNRGPASTWQGNWRHCSWKPLGRSTPRPDAGRARDRGGAGHPHLS